MALRAENEKKFLGLIFEKIFHHFYLFIKFNIVRSLFLYMWFVDSTFFQVFDISSDTIIYRKSGRLFLDSR